MLETDWGKEMLKDFVKVKLWLNKRPEDYQTDFTVKLFNAVGAPQYLIINEEGRVTAWFNGITAVMTNNVASSTGEVVEERKKRFQKFLDTAETKGFAFKPGVGFLPPDEQGFEK